MSRLCTDLTVTAADVVFTPELAGLSVPKDLEGGARASLYPE